MPGKIVEVACWAHTRRYFCKALASDPERAQHALSLIRALYKVERTIQDESRKKRAAIGVVTTTLVACGGGELYRARRT